jgi:hypothetical protein
MCDGYFFRWIMFMACVDSIIILMVTCIELNDKEHAGIPYVSIE